MVRLMCCGESRLKSKGVGVPGIDVAGLLGDVTTNSVVAPAGPDSSQGQAEAMTIG